MHFLILGGSGRTGRLVITYALSHNHSVTALIRTPSSLADLASRFPNLTLVPGSPTSSADITTAINATSSPPTAVIITLASLRKSNSPFSASISSPTFMTDANVAVLQAMREARPGIGRVVTLSAFGVGDSRGGLWAPFRWVVYSGGMRVGMEDHAGVERVLRRAEGVQWTLVRAAMLGDDEGFEGGVRVLGEKGEGAGLMEKVGRGRVAAFIVEKCLEGGEWVGRTPVIAD
ncbi:NAD(P)-binding protein [Mollisia scopiformis]|uniref:NAD(P)-binding protein n=1 Tax=Mollisia scopiformis TaxID=149040 RepID=A0A132B992_MOLSC|nr:NAD(P)-binding protein [Mollisia scopiformis]KUJ08966.1 NAD(P)-binding protein [Mollisia scopiformis]